MRRAIGIDVTSASEWQRRLARTPKLAAAAFTPAERAGAAGDFRRLASSWAVKEAIVKALGTGFDGIGWHGVEVRERAGPTILVGVESDHAAHTSFPTCLSGALLDAGDHVLAAVLEPRPRLEVAACCIPVIEPALRFGRRARSGGAARAAAEAAAAELLPDRARRFEWSSTPRGSPVLRLRDGPTLPVSLAHARGLAVGLVALDRCGRGPPRAPQPSHRRRFEVTVVLDLILPGLAITRLTPLPVN